METTDNAGMLTSPLVPPLFLGLETGERQWVEKFKGKLTQNVQRVQWFLGGREKKADGTSQNSSQRQYGHSTLLPPQRWEGTSHRPEAYF